MKDVALAWGAFRNLLAAVWRDPVWAIGAVVLSPIRLARHLFTTVVILLIVALGLGLAAQLIPLKWTVARSLADAAVLLVLAGIALRQLTNPLITHFGQRGGDTHGSARFATKAEIAPLTRARAGLLIGRDPASDRLLRYDGPAHLLTMAPTRSGKGVGTLIPNLLTADRSILCIDPKGENARITGRARERFGPVHVLDPFGVTDRPSAAFNPLDALGPNSLDVAEEAGTLAEALVVDDPGTGGEAHWNEEAKALITGLLLRTATHEPTARRHLGTLRQDLTLAPDAFADLLTRMQRSDAAGGLVARAANRQLGKAEREAASVLSVAQRHTYFLDSPRMTAVLGRSDFDFADLKRRTATVFLVLPPPLATPQAMLVGPLASSARSPRHLRALAPPPCRPEPHRHGPRAGPFPSLGSLPARRVRSPRPSRTDRTRRGPHGRLRRAALASTRHPIELRSTWSPGSFRPSSRTSINCAPPMARAPALSCPLPASCRSSAPPTTTAPASSPTCSDKARSCSRRQRDRSTHRAPVCP